MESENGADVEEFAQNILERARLRRQMFNSSAIVVQEKVSPDKSHTGLTSKSFAQSKDVSDTSPEDQCTNLEKSLSPKKDIAIPTDTDRSISVNSEPEVKSPAKIDEDKTNQDDKESKENSKVEEDDMDAEEVDFVDMNTPASAPLGKRRALHRLGQLHTPNHVIESPVHLHSALERTPEKKSLTSTSQVPGPAGRLSRLHALASSINRWEDDLTHVTSSTSRYNISPPKRQSGIDFTSKKSALTSPDADLPSSLPESNVNVKTALFESKIQATTVVKDPADMTVADKAKLFEKQAFFENKQNTKCTVKPQVVYAVKTGSFVTITNSPASATRLSPVKVPKGSVANQLRLFEAGLRKNDAGPTELSDLKHVEKESHFPTKWPNINYDTVTVSIPHPPSPPPMPNFDEKLSPVAAATSHTPESAPRTPATPGNRIIIMRRSASPSPTRTITPRNRTNSQSHKMTISPKKRSASPSPTRTITPRNLTNSQSPKMTISPKKRSASSSPTRAISPKMKYPEVKRIRTNESKAVRMYPSLADIELTETEMEAKIDMGFDGRTDDKCIEYEDEDMESDTSHMSLGTRIEKAAKSHATPTIPITQRRNRYYRPTEDFSTSLACQQIDAFIDDALEGQDYTLMDTVIQAELNAAVSSSPIPNINKTDASKNPSHKIDLNKSDVVIVTSEQAQDENTFKADDSLTGFAIDDNESTQEEITDIDDAKRSTIDKFCNESDISKDANTSNNRVKSKSDLALVDEYKSEQEDNTFEMPLACYQKQDSSSIVTSSPLFTKNKGQLSPIGTPLMYTVSVYRKQQELSATPGASKRVLDRVDTKQRVPSPPVTNNAAVNGQIRKLEEEVSSQQRAIAQVSKALNLCKSTVEFSESTENVECERVLLIATNKRTAILNEIHRLKTEGVLSRIAVISSSKHDLSPSCRGNMLLSNLAVQLKRDFVNKAMSGESVYHFLCMVRYRNHLEPSSLVSMGNGVNSSRIQGGLINFSNSFTIPNLEPDFQVKLEIYLLQTQREFLPHEAKYHIKLESKLKMTPKKGKQDAHSSKTLSRGLQESPGGPGAVRTSNFALCGSLSIDITTLQRAHWNLEGVRYSSPLEGNIHFRIQCSAEGGVEEHGFLTLFDDVSGFGAWHRRWCKLTPTQLAFWMYPEDENTKDPLGSIQLRHCVTSHVGAVSREICARPNTFLLVTTHSRKDGDTDSLVTSCHSDHTAIKHLISADMREERDLWCSKVNRALTNLRAWDPQAHSPDDTLF